MLVYTLTFVVFPVRMTFNSVTDISLLFYFLCLNCYLTSFMGLYECGVLFSKNKGQLISPSFGKPSTSFSDSPSSSSDVEFLHAPYLQYRSKEFVL
jgi:hypothetical protein